jgi:uncharacterized protein (TIGR00730 family)
MRVTVYGSSSPRTPQHYLDDAAELGRCLAAAGHVLVNGAGNGGCMGAINEACLAAAGRVVGIILKQFHDRGLGHDQLHEYIVVDTMRERKRLLAHGSQAYICLAGGPGTWEELWEIVVERQIGVTTAPLVLLDSHGFYDGFRQQLQRAGDEGFLYEEPENLLLVADSVAHAGELSGLW